MQILFLSTSIETPRCLMCACDMLTYNIIKANIKKSNGLRIHRRSDNASEISSRFFYYFFFIIYLLLNSV